MGVVGTAFLMYLAVMYVVVFHSVDDFFPGKEIVTLDEIGREPFRQIIMNPAMFWKIVGGVAVVILGASLYKMAHLNAGGLSIAESVGARIVDLNTQDEKERRLLNVVDEMAIASGTQVPMVGVLDNETNINAFAAAMSPRDAVVVVTRGALDTLTRDELQAVMGHEFSHLLNGDSKMNVTLAGWVWGLFFLTIVGRELMRGSHRGDSRRGSGGIVILLGFLTFVVGLVAHFFGQMIQALISRQREFLADASAVQFTRNPGGMLAALNKLRRGTSMSNPASSGLAHFFFAPAHAFNGFTGLLATHPPLEARMKAIDGDYKTFVPEEVVLADVEEAPAAQKTGFHPTTLVGVIAAAGSIDAATTMGAKERWPQEIVAALQTPEGAQAVLLGMALSRVQRAEYLAGWHDRISASVLRQMYELEPVVNKLDVKERFPLAQVALPRARMNTEEVKIGFLQALETVIGADGELSNFEAFYTQWLRHVLRAKTPETKFPPEEAASRVLSYLYAHQKDASPITDEELARVLSGLALKDLRAIRHVTVEALREALPALGGYNFLQRRELLIAAGRVLHLDNELTDEEAETLRLLAGMMDCPLPARLV